jgi:hypothetical protein
MKYFRLTMLAVVFENVIIFGGSNRVAKSNHVSNCCWGTRKLSRLRLRPLPTSRAAFGVIELGKSRAVVKGLGRIFDLEEFGGTGARSRAGKPDEVQSTISGLDENVRMMKIADSKWNAIQCSLTLVDAFDWSFKSFLKWDGSEHQSGATLLILRTSSLDISCTSA